MIPYFSIEYFYVGPFKLYTWGFFVALTFLIGAVYAFWQGKKIGVEFKKITYLIIFVYIGAIIGARLFFILQQPVEFFADPLLLFRTGEGGMMLWGGLLGGLIAGWLYIWKLENRLALIDALAPTVPLAIAIGRIGCFLSNDHLGTQTFLPWAIRWPDGSLRHPVALYLILFDLALFGFLFWYRKYAKWPGQIFLMFLILYSACRFLLDFSRDASTDPHYWIFSASQWISMFAFIAGLFIWFRLKRLTIFKKTDRIIYRN